MGSSKLTVIVNTRLDAAHPSYWRSDVVAMGRQDAQGVEVVTADVVDPHNAIRHDPARRARLSMHVTDGHRVGSGAALSAVRNWHSLLDWRA